MGKSNQPGDPGAVVPLETAAQARELPEVVANVVTGAYDARVLDAERAVECEELADRTRGA